MRTIVVDKDCTEWKVLREEFPDATIQWHVMKAMFKKMVECDIENSENTKQEIYFKTNE